MLLQWIQWIQWIPRKNIFFKLLTVTLILGSPSFAASLDRGSSHKQLIQAPSVLQASAEGLACIANLRSGGGITYSALLAGSAATAALAAGTAAGTIFLYPYASSPALLLASIGGLGSFAAGWGITQAARTKKVYYRRAKLIESAYLVLNIFDRGQRKRQAAIARITHFRDKYVLNSDLHSELNIEQVADRIARLNEAGAFCSANVFADRGNFRTSLMETFNFDTHSIKKEKISLARNILRYDATDEHINAFRNARLKQKIFLQKEETKKAAADALAEKQRIVAQKKLFDAQKIRQKADASFLLKNRDAADHINL